jgi:tetratricopeptide (TPR) repeat protein
VRAEAHEAGDAMVEASAIGNLGYTEARKGNFVAAIELVREARGLMRDLGLTWLELVNLNNLAEISAEAGRVDEARGFAQEALALGLRIADRLNIVAALATSARVARLDGDLFEAGRRWGAVEAEVERRSIGRWQDSVDQTGTKVVGDEPEFQRGLVAGRALSLDEAAREAAAAGLD